MVEQRTHELSVRRALGAGPVELMTMLLRESLRPVIVGSLCGLFVSAAGGRVLQSFLFGVSARDPLAFTGAVVVLVVAASAAVLVPARRTSHMSPAQLLKLG